MGEAKKKMSLLLPVSPRKVVTGLSDMPPTLIPRLRSEHLVWASLLFSAYVFFHAVRALTYICLVIFTQFDNTSEIQDSGERLHVSSDYYSLLFFFLRLKLVKEGHSVSICHSVLSPAS